jgi:hypothetical protein
VPPPHPLPWPPCKPPLPCWNASPR